MPVPWDEVTEVPVYYTAEFKCEPDKCQIIYFHFGKKDDSIYHIKTYVDYGLDKNPKEEEKIDPIAATLEHLANCKASERMWLQILAIPHAKKSLKAGYLRKQGTWVDDAKKKINEMMQRDKGNAAPAEFEGQPRLTTGERNTVEAIERNTSKLAYETAIRFIYAAPPEQFNGEPITAGIRAMLGSYEIGNRNGIGIRWRTDFDYNIFSDYSGKRRILYKKKELDYYKMRFYLPFDVSGGADQMKVFSVEELATMWHIPGQSIVTPGVARVESLRRDAPSNLPVSGADFKWD